MHARHENYRFRGLRVMTHIAEDKDVDQCRRAFRRNDRTIRRVSCILNTYGGNRKCPTLNHTS